MGMYTEIQFTAELDFEKSKDIVSLLRYMTGDDTVDERGLTIPDHSLFKTDRWKHMLNSTSYYFAGEPYSEVHVESDYKLISLTVLSNFKNYDNEIAKFLDWIAPYVYVNGNDRVFAGYIRYEGDIDPTLVYFTNDGVKLVEVSA